MSPGDNGVSSSYSPDEVLSSEGGHSSSVSGGHSPPSGSVSIISSSGDDGDAMMSWSSDSSVQQDSDAGQTSSVSSEQASHITSSDNAPHMLSSYFMDETSSTGQLTGDASGSSSKEEKQDGSSHGDSADDDLLSSADVSVSVAASSSDNSMGSSSTGAHQGSADEPHGSSSQVSELLSASDTADSQDQDSADASILSDDQISSEMTDGLNAKSSNAMSSGIDSADETSSSGSIVSSSTLNKAASSSAQDYIESPASTDATSERTEIEIQSESVTSADEWSSSELPITLTNSSSSDSSINISSTGFSSEFSNNGSDDDDDVSTMMVDSADELSSNFYSSGSSSTDDAAGNPPSQSNETSSTSDYHILSSEDASDALSSSYQQASDDKSTLSASGDMSSSTVASSSGNNDGVSSFETEGSSMVRSNGDAASSSSDDDASENYQIGDTSETLDEKSSQGRSSGSSNGLLTSVEESGESSEVSSIVSSNVDNDAYYKSSSTEGTAASSQVSSAENSHLQSADDEEEATASSGDDLLASQRATSTSPSARQSSIQFNLIRESDHQAMMVRGNSESIGVAGKFREEKDDEVNPDELPLETDDDTPAGTPLTMRANGGEASSTAIKSDGDQELKFPIFFTVMLSGISTQMETNRSSLSEADGDAFSWEYAKNLSIAVVDLDLDPIVSVLVLRLRTTADDGDPYSVIVDTLVRTTTSKGSRDLEVVLRQSPASLFPHATQHAVLISNVLTNPADIIEWGNTEFYSGVSNRADSEEVTQGTSHESTWQTTASAPLPPPNMSSGTCRRELQARDGMCCFWPMVLDESRNCCDKSQLDECQVCGGNGGECTKTPHHQGSIRHDGSDVVNEASRSSHHHAAPSELLPKRLAAPSGLRVMDLLAGTPLPLLQASVANRVKPANTPKDIHNPGTASVHHATPTDGGDDECSNGAAAGCEVTPSTDDGPIGLDDSPQARRHQDLLSCSGDNCPDNDRHQQRPPVDDGCPTGSPGDTAGNPAKPCTGNGVCSLMTGSCSCHIGFAGSNCGQCAPHFVPFAGGCVPAALTSRSSNGGVNGSSNGDYSTSGSLSSWLGRDYETKPEELGHHQDAASSAKTSSSSGRGRLRDILTFRNLAITLACIAASAAAFVAAAYAFLIQIRRSAESDDDDRHHASSAAVGIERHHQRDLTYAGAGCVTAGREVVNILGIQQMRSDADREEPGRV